jgi:opacity protein-like surface antigen
MCLITAFRRFIGYSLRLSVPAALALSIASVARADDEESRWSVSITGGGSFQKFENTRLPDRDGVLFFDRPSLRQFSTGSFDHYKQGSTQSFDWSNYKTMGATVEYRLLSWLGIELVAQGMSGLAFERPDTIEIGYFQPDDSLYVANSDGYYMGGPLEALCADRNVCRYYGLEYHSFSFSGRGEVEGLSGMLSAKLYGPELSIFTPYLSLGAGWMQVQAEEKGMYIESEGSRGYNYEDFNVIIPVVQEGSGSAARPGCDPCRTAVGTYSLSTTARAPMFAVGLGTSVRLTEHVSVEIGGKYLLPRGDLEQLRAYSVGANVFWHF